MSYLNVEIKARSKDPGLIREYLLAHNARFVGVDEQTDTYFKVQQGRLKLRQGTIENNLIYYKRANTSAPKLSEFQIVSIENPEVLREILKEAYGIRIVVLKKREIYYIENVKFHIDEVPGLGSFVEIEAGNMIGDKSHDELNVQCDFYMKELSIREEDLIKNSYSDMIEQL